MINKAFPKVFVLRHLCDMIGKREVREKTTSGVFKSDHEKTGDAFFVGVDITGT